MASIPNWPNIAQGQSGTNVKALQLLLAYRGYSLSDDGIFGSVTKSAVMSFQTSRGLSADGIAGANTLSALIVTVANRTNNSAARAAQTLLAKFESLIVDGDFYTGSAQATATFQANMGIFSTGIVDDTTWRYLFGYDAYPGGSGGTVPAGVYASVCSVVSTLSEAQMNANAEYIYDYLANQGFTKNAACAVLGNMQAESGLNPGIWETFSQSLSYGYGLVQWTPATNFINRAVSLSIINSASASSVNNLANNDPQALMDAELDCLIWCCTKSPCDYFSPIAGSSMDHTGIYLSFNNFKASILSVQTLAIVFHDHYERSGDDATALATRATYAQNWYNYF